MDLGDARAVRPGREEDAAYGWPADTTPDCGFSIELPDRTFFFYSDNADSAKAWVEDLRRAKAIAQQRRQAVAERAKENVLHSGYLTKQGGRQKNWRERFVVLDKDMILSYYNDETTKEANGFLSLGDAIGIRSGYSEKEVWPEGVSSYCGLCIDMPGRTFFFYAKTPESAQAWINALSRAATDGHTRRATISVAQARKPGAANRHNPKHLVRTGVLTKQGGTVKVWKARFAVLDQDGILSYYPDKRSRTPAGQIDCAEARTVRPGKDEAPPGGWPAETTGNCAFGIELPGRTFFMFAETPELALAWMEDIRKAKDKAKDRHMEALKRRVESVVHKGYLTKQGGAQKNWRERFVVLDVMGQLCYYADEAASTPNGNLDIFQARSITPGYEVAAPNGWPDSVSAYCGFSIDMPKRRFFFYAKTPELATAWVEVLQKAQRGELVNKRASAMPEMMAPAVTLVTKDSDDEEEEEEEEEEELDEGEEDEEERVKGGEDEDEAAAAAAASERAGGEADDSTVMGADADLEELRALEAEEEAEAEAEAAAAAAKNNSDSDLPPPPPPPAAEAEAAEASGAADDLPPPPPPPAAGDE